MSELLSTVDRDRGEEEMMYIRKTRDVWEVQQYTGSQYGWECVSAADTFKEAREDAKS